VRRSSGGAPELSASLCLYLGGYESFSSKYPGYRLLVEFLSELSFRYLLLAGSSSVLVTVALVQRLESWTESGLE